MTKLCRNYIEIRKISDTVVRDDIPLALCQRVFAEILVAAIAFS